MKREKKAKFYVLKEAKNEGHLCYHDAEVTPPSSLHIGDSYFSIMQVS